MSTWSEVGWVEIPWPKNFIKEFQASPLKMKQFSWKLKAEKSFNVTKIILAKFTDKAPMGDSERFSTVARSSSTDAEMGAVPLFSGLISTRIFFSISSSLSLSELE